MDCPKRSSAAGLPDDLFVEILSRVSVKDLHRSMCVSRGWYYLITDPLHREKLPHTLGGFFFDGSGGKRRDVDVYVDEDEDEYSSDEDQYNGNWLRQPQQFGHFTKLTRYTLPVDPSFSFLEELRGVDNLRLLGSCNGLLLFEHGLNFRALGYIVCNPATEQWTAVPSDWTPADPYDDNRHAYLVFNPAVSSHFHIVMFWEEDKEGGLVTVHAYSSKAGVWSHSETDWAEEERQGKWEGWRRRIKCKSRLCGAPSAFVNGMLYLILGENQILEVDVEGKTRRIIPAPCRVGGGCAFRRALLVGQSQGRLYCIISESELSIWVLEEQQWVLKHSVSLLHLLGQESYGGYSVVAIHPDCNLLFFVHCWTRQLISYDINHEEVHALYTFERDNARITPRRITPYVPYFLESPVLTNKH